MQRGRIIITDVLIQELRYDRAVWSEPLIQIIRQERHLYERNTDCFVTDEV